MDAIKEDGAWFDFFYVEIMTGLHRGEICGLRWEDFDEADGTLKVCRTVRRDKGMGLTTGDTKTYAGTRKSILLPSVTAILKGRKQISLTAWTFPNPLCLEQPTAPDAAYRRMKQLMEQSGLPDIRFHDLRHTLATDALAHGMDIKTLSTILRHVSSATALNTYSHITDEMRQKAAAKIDKGIAKAEPQLTEESTPQERTMTAFQARKRWSRKEG